MHKDINLTQLNDQDFMLWLYQEYCRLMHYTAGKYNTDTLLNDDIVQECLIKLTARVRLLRELPQASLAKYVVVSVRNTAINHVKREQRDKENVQSLEQMGEDIVAAPSISLEDELLKKEFRQEIEEIWTKIDEENRILLEGRYFFGYDDNELSKLLGCKPSSIRMKLTRARRQVRGLLEDGEKFDKTGTTNS